ncbi:collagen binding domain-containing protein, partial [uncultured Ruminococcus sp.]|uniref:MSCRAMM family protein n=1 Tax=uncultured Ruminococcus sp. TaxID=165186 RepID=UPI0025F92FCB
MRKTFGKRLICGLTSTVMAATLSLGNITPLNFIGASAATFNYSMPAENGRTANEQCAKIRFVDKFNNSMSVTAPDNTYYLLVHAVGAEPDDGDPYTNYYPDSDGGDHYQLIEIDANGTSWTSERFNVIETRMVAGDSDGGTEKEMVADTVSIDGTILKNNDPTKELTLADARNRNNCSVAEDIEGFRLTDGNFSEHTYAENTWEIDTHVFTATYDGETVPVSISVYDYDGTTPTALENSVRSNYYLLTTLTDNYGNKLGWDLSCIDIFGKKNLNVGVGEFTAFGAPEQKLAYNPEIHKLNTRIYRTVSPSGVLEKPEDCTNTSKALDTIPDFSFIRTDDPQDIRIKQDKISYQVKLDFESPVTIEDSENIFLLVKVAHQTTEDTYYLGKVTMNNSASGTINIENWQDANGNPAEFGTYNGNRYYYRLMKATADFNLANRNNPDKFSEFNDGDIFKGFTVSYTKEQKRISDSDTKTTVYADTITFKKVSATSDYDFKSILGNSLYFGMTADRYQQKGHTETNLAVNHGNFTGDLQSDLSGNYGGDFYIANFVKFIDHHTMVKDPEGGIDVGHETKHCRDGCTLHVDDMSRAKGNNANVAIVIDDADYMQNSVVTPMIRDMRSMSAELLSHSANAALTVLGGNEAYLDTTGFPYNATIYVDADKYADVIAKSEGLRMKISAGQTIVFNYDSSSEVTLGKYDIEIYDENGDPIPEREYAAKPIDKGSADTEPLAFENSNKNNQNTWLDQVARHVVWNLASAETVSIGSTAGIVLIPNSESDTEIKDTATGWLISAGYVENSSEWHFVYNDMPGNTGILVLNKTDITGKEMVAGAQLTIYDENGKAVANWTSDGENVKSVWLAPGSYTLKETNKGGKFTDENTGKTYTVTDSEFKFTVEAVDGSHDCTIIPEESQNSVKDDFVDDAKDAYYVYEETVTAGADQASAKTQQKITLCDMEAVEGADVTFSKKDIANKDELAGAKLRLTNRNVDWTKVGAANSGLTAVRDADGNVIGVEWTSTGKPIKIKGLPEGRGYILTERSESTNGEVVIGGETYFVVESELRFAINEGEVIGVESPDLKREADSTSETSYYLADANKKIITVCDAKKSVPAKIVINKYDLTGDTEIDGAKLIITGTTKDGTAVSLSNTSHPREVWEIELEDGNYVLRETGDVVVTDDGIYDVVSSEMSFTVAGGKIIEKSSNADISENGFNKKADEGYYAVGENAADDSSYIYVCDARRTDVKLSKQNTGGEEIDGAVITLTGKDADNKAILFTKDNFDADAISDDGETITWTSGKTPTEIKGLPNGTYTMHEETAPSGYQTTTDITFKVEGGKVTVVGVNGKVVNGNTVVMTDDMNTKVVINKYDLTGNTEVSGAVLTLTDEDGNLITVDAAGAKITNPWTSVSGKSFEVSLKNGKYTLTETADDNGSEIYDEKTDKYYTVIPNALSFEVKDGKIISKDAGQTTLSNAPNRAADEEYFFVTADNEIGVCDAEIKSADIVINKYDITGSNEVAGAQLTITGEGIDWDKTAELNKGVKTVGEAGAAVTGLQWKSKAGETFNVKLRDGTYTLTETSIDKDGDTEYKVIPSSVQFVVENGKVTAVSSDHTDISSSFQTAAKDETTDSYVVGKAGSNEIFVCDAKKIDETVDIVIDKRDITGKTEVKGARLTLTNTSADTRIDWAKVVDKTSVKNTNTSIELLPGGGITWVSDGTAVTVSGLPNGAGYVLAETADGNETLIDGKYTVIPTELRFNIADGKAAVDAASNTAPTSAPANGDGYFDVSGNNIITVCNAEVTDVTLSKKDITGKNEVLYAKITIKNAKGDTVDEWVS